MYPYENKFAKSYNKPIDKSRGRHQDRLKLVNRHLVATGNILGDFNHSCFGEVRKFNILCLEMCNSLSSPSFRMRKTGRDRNGEGRGIHAFSRVTTVGTQEENDALFPCVLDFQAPIVVTSSVEEP